MCGTTDRNRKGDFFGIMSSFTWDSLDSIKAANSTLFYYMTLLCKDILENNPEDIG